MSYAFRYAGEVNTPAAVAARSGATIFSPAALAVWLGLPALMLFAAIRLWRAHRRRRTDYNPNAEGSAEVRRRISTFLNAG